MGKKLGKLLHTYTQQQIPHSKQQTFCSKQACPRKHVNLKPIRDNTATVLQHKTK